MTFTRFTRSRSENGQYWGDHIGFGEKILRSGRTSSRSQHGTCKSYRLSRISLLTLVSLALFLLVGQTDAAAVAIARDSSVDTFIKRDTTPSVQLPSPPLDLPQPFDQSIGDNFTSTTCPTFFTQFLADKDFQQCYPFSLLLQVSCSLIHSCVS
jgi:hypothetical protein